MRLVIFPVSFVLQTRHKSSFSISMSAVQVPQSGVRVPVGARVLSLAMPHITKSFALRPSTLD